MTTETRGQNSWLNYGPHGEANRTASSAETIFAPQKVGLMPEWASEEGMLADPQSGMEARDGTTLNQELDWFAAQFANRYTQAAPVRPRGEMP